MFGVSVGIMDGAGGAAGGSFESIQTVSTTSGTASFTSIPSSYKHLQIRGLVRAVNDYGLYFNFNSDTTSVYTVHTLSGNGSAASASGNAPTSSFFDAFTQTNSASLSNTYGVFVLDLIDYSSTTKFKTLRYFGGKDNNDSTGRVALESSVYRSTSAISRIDITNLDAWASATTFSLYGIKG